MMDERIRARRRAVTAARVRRRRRLGRSLVLTVLILLVAAALATTPIFDIERVEVDGVQGAAAEQVRTIAAVAPGENLLRVDRGAIAEAVLALPWTASVDVRRVPPATLRITVAPRRPVAVVRIPNASWLVDDAGVVVAGGASPGLPVIVAPDSVIPPPGAEISDAAIRNALAVRRALPAPLRRAVDRYDATSERALRFRLQVSGTPATQRAHPGEQAEVTPRDFSPAPSQGAGQAGHKAGQESGQQGQEGGIWVRFGTVDRAQAKARAIDLLIEQARAQALLQGRPDLGIAEIDVRAPDNPVLIPDSDQGL